MKPIKQGTVYRQNFVALPEHLASAIGNHGVDVVSTTSLILYFEAAANYMVLPYFEQDELTVGTHVSIDHLAPAAGSKEIEVTAVLERQQGRRLEFDVIARQEGVIVMQGKHHRAVMTRSRFSSEKTEGGASTPEIDFWFDFHSPWCYFASHQIGEIGQQFNAKINWKPVHLANLNEAVDGRRPLEANSRFVRWYQQDQRDTATMLGLPFAPHQEYPKRPSRALRAALFAADHGLAEAFVKAVMRGYWSDQQDISELKWLIEIGVEVGLDAAGIAESVSAPEYKQRLNENLNQAIQQGLFGLPAAVVNDKIFWGNDRLELLKHYLSGLPPRLPT